MAASKAFQLMMYSSSDDHSNRCLRYCRNLGLVHSKDNNRRYQNSPPTSKNIAYTLLGHKRVKSLAQQQQHLTGSEGVENIRQFLNGRWKGIRPVLWNTSLMQEELQEVYLSPEIRLLPCHLALLLLLNP